MLEEVGVCFNSMSSMTWAMPLIKAESCYLRCISVVKKTRQTTKLLLIFAFIFTIYWLWFLFLLHVPAFSLISRTLGLFTAETLKSYTIMDNDWFIIGFISYLLALNADFEVLGLASGMCPMEELFGYILRYILDTADT